MSSQTCVGQSAAAVMSDPSLLHERPDIPTLLTQRCRDDPQATAADGPDGRLAAMTKLALKHRLAQGSDRG